MLAMRAVSYTCNVQELVRIRRDLKRKADVVPSCEFPVLSGQDSTIAKDIYQLIASFCKYQ